MIPRQISSCNKDSKNTLEFKSKERYKRCYSQSIQAINTNSIRLKCSCNYLWKALWIVSLIIPYNDPKICKVISIIFFTHVLTDPVSNQLCSNKVYSIEASAQPPRYKPIFFEPQSFCEPRCQLLYIVLNQQTFHLLFCFFIIIYLSPVDSWVENITEIVIFLRLVKFLYEFRGVRRLCWDYHEGQ